MATLAAAATVTALGVPTGPASAAPSAGAGATRWHIESTPNPKLRDGVFDGISCQASSCTAVGSDTDSSGAESTLAEGWNGTRWKVEPTAIPVGEAGAQLSGVSCPSAGACVAVGVAFDAAGEEPLAEAWNGATWTVETLPTISTGGFLDSVSCTAGGCVAVGGSPSGTPVSFSWNGTRWSRHAVAVPAGAVAPFLSSVACGTAGCEAVGSYSDSTSPDVPLAELWNGTAWSVQTTPVPPKSFVSELNAVSCAGPRACLAVGSQFTITSESLLAERWNGTAWSLTKKTTVDATSALSGVSCASATDCTAVGDLPGPTSATAVALGWNGTTWTSETVPVPTGATNSSLLSVSCAAAMSCLSVGQVAVPSSPSEVLSDVWNGTSWSLQRARLRPGLVAAALFGVSCPSPSDCVAVGSDAAGGALAETWNGTTWSVGRARTVHGGSALYDVSCLSASDCIAVGASAGSTAGLAEAFDGTSWRVLETPHGIGALESVSCSSPTSCVAVGINESGGAPASLAETFDGTGWKLTRTPNPPGASASEMLSVSCSSATACTTVGVVYNDSDMAGPLAESWNGTTWTDETVPGSAPGGFGLTGVSCPGPSGCVAIGYSFDRLGSPSADAEIWNGTTWTLEDVPTPRGGAVLYGLGCSSASSCMTVGGQADGTLAESWNGSAWTATRTANPAGSGGTGYLNEVTCSSASCTSVGDYVDQSGVERTLAEAT